MTNQKKLIISIKNIFAPLFFRTSVRAFKRKDVPYYCQWESRELAADILAKKIKAADDPKWKNSGAQTKEEYDQWSWTACGMACLKMILGHTSGKKIPLVTLGKQCLKYGGYKLPLESSHGLYYGPFVEFVGKEYGLQAKVNALLTLAEITQALSQNKYVIASVSPAIRDPKSTPKHRGGHLVLIVGYDLDKKQLSLHNPSGDSVKSQEYAEISFTDFEKFFAYKGIILKPNIIAASSA